MPQSAPLPRALDELLLLASDVSVVDRATLSLWHFQQLLRRYLPTPQVAVSGEKTPENEDKENSTPSTAVAPTPLPSVELEDGMSVAAVAFEDTAMTGNVDDLIMELDAESEDANDVVAHARMALATKVGVVYKRYRCVLSLDASPSSLSIDLASGKVFLDMLYESVELFVRSLLRPVEVGGASFEPEFHVSVMVQGALVESLCVLVQGFVLEVSNADRLLSLVRQRLSLLEDEWAAAAARAIHRPHHDYSSQSCRASLSSMLQNAVFALNSLPSGAAPLLVLATDGVVDLFNTSTYDNLVMQLVRHDVQCHFIRVGGHAVNDPNASFGFVPDVDLLQFVAEASGGVVVDYVGLHEACWSPVQHDRVKSMTSFQASLLVRPSRLQAIATPVLKLDTKWCASFDGVQYRALRPYRMWREKVHEYRIHADVDRIIEARIREGFLVNKLHIRNFQRLPDGSLGKMPPVGSPAPAVPTEGPPPVPAATKILLVCVLQWKQNVWLEYVISSTIEHQSAGRSSGPKSNNAKGLAVSGTASSLLGQLKKDFASSEWYVKVNVLADAEFLRAFEDTRTGQNIAKLHGVGASQGPASLHEFIRHVQDVDRVLLHLMTAAATVITATDVSSQFSFGTQASHNSMTAVHTTNKTQLSIPVFGIIGELSPVLWHRWFHVDRFEVLSVVVDDPSPDVFYPRADSTPRMSRTSVVVGQSQYRNMATGRSRAGRRGGMPLETNVHPLMIETDHSVDRVRAAILKWSSQRIGKDLYLRFLASDTQRTDDRGRATGSTVATTPVGGAQVVKVRRQQRSSLNSATISAQIATGIEQQNQMLRREEAAKGALCFVRVEIKNRTLVVVHVAFYSCSASTRRETLAELKTIVTGSEVNIVTPSVPTHGGIQSSTTPNAQQRKLVLCHRMISRLLVTHDSLVLEDSDRQEKEPTHSRNPEQPLVACCGGSELQLRSVFGAFMWHSSWKWRLARSNAAALTEVMRHLHEARLRAGFWVLDWKLEEDGDVMRVLSVVFGREILMEDENGHLKTSLIQYAIRRTTDNCLLTSFWMEPQYGFAKRTMAGGASTIDRSDTFHWALRHAIGHEVSLDDSEEPNDTSSDAPIEESAMYLDEGKLLQLIREYIFDTDRHLLSCLHTFERLTSIREGSVDAGTQAGYSTTVSPLGVIGIGLADEDDAQESGLFVPAFSTARILDAATRSTEHFLMYLERGIPTTPEVTSPTVPALSSANLYLYSMLERTLRSLSDCEVAWTDFHGDLVSEKPGQASGAMRIPATTSQMPQWFVQSARRAAPRHQELSLGRCFAKLLPNDTVVLAFLPAISTLEMRKRPLLSPVQTSQDSQQNAKLSSLSRWDQQHQLKSSVSLEVGESTSSSSTSMLKMSVSADDIVLYQERRQSFREGYKSWRMGHFQGAKDDKSHRAGHGLPLSPHPKVASFSEDYEFCDALCREAELGCDFHLLIEKADGVLGSGYFQVAFYECSLAQLSSALTTQLVPSGEDASYQALLGQLFTRGTMQERGQDPPHIAEPNDRAPVVSKTFGNRPGSQLPPPSPVTTTPAADPSDAGMDLSARHLSMTFRKKIKRAHEHNFSRGVYVALRDGSPVQQSDLIQALSSCVEVPMDLDITLLYRMLQVDMIRETVPRSALRSSMIDLLSGKPIRDALKDRLDKCVERILATLFQGIDDTKYFFFVGNENMAIDDVVGVADNEGDPVQLMVEEEDASAVISQPPRLVKSVTIATDTHGFGEKDVRRTEFDDEVDAEAMAAGIVQEEITSGEVYAEEPQEQLQQINQEEDAELYKDVAAATSSFSSPFFFRFESREIAQDPEVRSRSTSSGTAMVKAMLPPPARPSLQRSSSSKSFLDIAPTAKPSTPSSLPQWQKKALADPSGGSSSGVVGGVSEIAEWAANASGPKIALRLVTLTLPNEQLLERTRGHQMGVDIQDKRHRPTAAELFSSLPFFQRQVLKQLRKSLKEWSSLEILRILRSVETITPAVALLVQKLFSQLPASRITRVKYPVDFVNVHHESLDPMVLLEKELKLGTESLRLVECGGLYFVANQRDDESCEVPYWAFLKMQGDHIELQLHHPSLDSGSDDRDSNTEWFDRLAVLTVLHVGINAICKRVNQYLLLLQLHETRSCNELLLPLDPGTSSAGPPSPTSSSAPGLQQHKRDPPFFWPGQFACDLKYAAFFRLNERMVASIALTTLCTQALEQFQVHNRRHVFVYRDRGGHVFYIKMSVAAIDVVMSTKQPALRHVVGSNGSSSSAGILLEVFGVCEPGDEVTQELCKLLERKLDETMQLILMKLLARNTKFQLSASDMAFMCPPDAGPATSTVYRLPSALVPASDASTMLLFLCQTLGMTSYIRQMNTLQLAAPNRFERQSSNTSSAVVEFEPLFSSSNGVATSPDVALSTKPEGVIQDASVMHPAMFSRESRQSISFFDATTTSPVFFTNSGVQEPSPIETSLKREPVLLGEATFAINLNSELRLSPGFLARVGKGLAVLRVEILESDTEVAGEDEDITELVIRVPVDNSTTSSKVPNLFVRCQMWIRGPIQLPAFRDVYEAHLKEALYDYAIETEIRTVRNEQKVTEEEAGKAGGAHLPRRMNSLVELLEAASATMSSSVTKLTLPLAIPSWDIDNIAIQVAQFLRTSLPIHARPAVYVSKSSQFVRVEIEDIRLHKSPRVKLVPMPVVPESSGSSNTLIHSDSIQSDLSDVDSIASFRQSMGSSTIESLTTASLHASSSSSISLPREYSTSELMFYSMAKGASADSVKAAGATPVVQQRSFYFFLDVSTAQDGVVFYGYNLSHQVLDGIALQLAKVLTWSLLRDRMLRCLLLQRGGVAYASPNGAPVVQPRAMLVGGAGGRSHPGAEFTVSFVEFRSKIVPVLQAFGVIPRSIETISRQDVSAFARLLKEFGIQVADGRDALRSRSTSSVSSTRHAIDDASSSRPSASGLRSGGGIASSSNRSHGVDKPPAKTSSGGTTVPSPTKRPSVGSQLPSISLGGAGATGNTGGSQGPGNAARARANPTAANALMAARARARGGGFPGKMGPGISSNRGAAAGEVAPWDLPVANAKGNSTAGVAKTLAPSASIQQPPPLGRMGSTDFNTGAGETKRTTGPSSALLPAASAGLSVPGMRSGSSKNPWRKLLAQTWGPRYKYCPKNTFVEAVDKHDNYKTRANGDGEDSAHEGGKASDPLRHFGSAFLRREQSLLLCMAASDSCIALYRRIKQIIPQQEHAIEGARETTVRSMLETGHLLFHQRFRVSYIERWEVVKIEEEYLSDGSNTGRLRALQASMDLVNLLSYKQEFVFQGNECVVAKLLTEHTVQAMTGKEGQAVREMKMQILKAVFHSRMEVVHRFVEQYVVHLRALGFYHLRLPSSRLGRKHHTDAAPLGGDGVGAGNGTATHPRASAVDTFAMEDEAFSEFFVHDGSILRKMSTTSRGGGTRSGSRAVPDATNDVLMLELKCDHSGVQLSVVLLNEQDLQQQQLGHQRHLDEMSRAQSTARGEMVKQVALSLRGAANTRLLIHDFTIRFFHQCLLDWTLLPRPDVVPPPVSSVGSLHNMVKGIRCFLRTYPRASLAKTSQECALEAATVELPVRNLQSDFSESILVKILLRYIGCHGSRYEVTDLTQFGTPDTIACHSAAGNFFNRQTSMATLASINRGGGAALTNKPGYSLLITTQELWKGKKRPKNSVLLVLIRIVPLSLSTNVVLLPIERAMHEAELYVKELFRTAAANYERDLLWSRLLYSDSHGVATELAQSLALPFEHFRIEVGPQQLEECLRLSVCIPLQKIDPELSELLEIDDVCWQEFALRLRDVYAGQVREYQFEGHGACHFLLLCPDARDLMIHLTFPSGIASATLDGDANRVHIDICRREEPASHKFSLPQRRAITDFVNSVVHWLWRCLLYD